VGCIEVGLNLKKADVVSFTNETKIYFDSCLLWRWNCEWGCLLCMRIPLLIQAKRIL